MAGDELLVLPLPQFILDIESRFSNLDRSDEWFQEYWHYGNYGAVAYLVLIYLFKKYMDTREPFELRRPLIVWNGFLSIFSILGAYRLVPAFIQLWSRSTLRETICYAGFFENGTIGLWTLLFILSKVPELIDTFFLIARKRPLMFLHWYHHATVLMYAFYIQRDRMAGGAYYSTMNYTVHAIMYTYYFLRACNVRVPKNVAMLITSLQILQMVVGVFVTMYLWTELGTDCKIHRNNVLAATIMYSTYFFLFARFFVKAYITGGKRTVAKKTK